jgi:glycosyltransferase involved in cell wall biosynthesis
VADAPLRILFASPVWWPSRAFGGPVVAARELVRRFVTRGHEVEVLTSTIVDLQSRPSWRSAVETVDGATVHYLATPVHYRWMGIAPTLPLALARTARPDVLHVFGFRDPITTGAAAWARLRGIPYVFEPLGMYRPRLRKVPLKRALDATLYHGVAQGAAGVVAASERERDDLLAGGLPSERVHVRGNGFPAPADAPAVDGELRRRLGIPTAAPIVLYVGRIAAGKGIDHLIAAARDLKDAHVVLAGPDDRHGTTRLIQRANSEAGTAGRIHVLPPSQEPPVELYPQADVFVLASEGESFGLVAAEAAAAGTPVIVSDRCGVASFFRDDEALVVPYERQAIIQAVRRVLHDSALREQLARGGMEAARRTSWDQVTDAQETIYREVCASRTAATKFSTLGP